MNLEKYEYNADPQFTNFKFESVGPNGVIKKIVRYEMVSSLSVLDGNPVINVAFGDWNEENSSIDDTVVSDNKDKDKILATVASTIAKYVEENGGFPVYAIGSTPAKTRLYQMGINAHRPEIEKLFRVYGRLKGKWEGFKPGINYEAFLGFKK